MRAINIQLQNLGLKNHQGLPLSVIEQAALPKNMPYESFISETGQIPTRDNLHDFFNALVWLSFPETKLRLNAVQAEQISLAGITNRRGELRDAATVFDENGAILVIRETNQGDHLVQALYQRQWHSAFIDQRTHFDQHAELWIFGHAAMEKLMSPYKAITAHAVSVLVSNQYFLLNDVDRLKWLDHQVSSQLTNSFSHSKSKRGFIPIPVLGIPGWCNFQDEAFYADMRVFRPATETLQSITRKC